MHHWARTILWIYIILLLAGGLVGFFKAKSRISLMTSVISAALLALAMVPRVFDPNFRLAMVDVILALLLIVFGIRLAKKKKFMPSGLMLALTALTLAMWNILSG